MVKILNPLLTFSSTVPSLIMKDALSSALIRSLDSKLLDCTNYDFTQRLLFGHTSQTSSNNFKIINTSIDYILSSKRFDEPLFKINSFISSSVNPNLINNFLFYNRQFSVLHIYLLLLLVILYSQVLSGILVSGDRVILFVCVFFVYIFTRSEV